MIAEATVPARQQQCTNHEQGPLNGDLGVIMYGYFELVLLL